jgi:hypothetical protein
MRGITAVLLLALAGCDDGGGGAAADAGEPDALRGVADAAAVDGAAPDAASPDAAPAADMGVPCPPGGYAALEPAQVVDAGDAPRHGPRAVWTGSEWGVVWLADVPGGPGEVRFRRYDGDGRPAGEALTLGRARSPIYEVLATGAGYVVVWSSVQAPGEGGFQGVRLQRISADGAPAGVPVDVPQTFDVDRLAAGWAPQAGGMVAFTRGQGGGGGLFAVALEPDGQPGRAVRLFETAARSPAVAYGDGVWGVAWLDPGSQRPADILFQRINDFGEPAFGPPTRETDAGARIGLDLAFGGGQFGIAWSSGDALRLTLVDADGRFTQSPDVPGGGRVTDLAWLSGGDLDAVFGVAWQDDATSTAGFTGINRVGQQRLGPVALETPAGAKPDALAIAGDVTRVGAFRTLDPVPQATGFSPAAHVEFARLGRCR